MYLVGYYCYLLAAVMTVLIGLLYATRKQVMPISLEGITNHMGQY